MPRSSRTAECHTISPSRKRTWWACLTAKARPVGGSATGRAPWGKATKGPVWRPDITAWAMAWSRVEDVAYLVVQVAVGRAQPGAGRGQPGRPGGGAGGSGDQLGEQLDFEVQGGDHPVQGVDPDRDSVARSAVASSRCPDAPNRSLIGTVIPALARMPWTWHFRFDRSPTSLARCRTQPRSSRVAGGYRGLG